MTMNERSTTRGLSMFIVTLYSYQNFTTFQLAEIWDLEPPLSGCGARFVIKIHFEKISVLGFHFDMQLISDKIDSEIVYLLKYFQ